MRIERLHIDGFGIHRDLTLSLAPGLNILSGANEAGKSTLHAFVRAMLHGLPRGVRHDPLQGGRHGGALWLEVGGERVRIERIFSGKGRGGLVEDEEGRELGQAHLASLLGHVDQRVYRSVFAFDLEDLGERGLEAEEIEHRLFDAGLLGAGRSFAEVAKRLQEARERWLKPRSGALRELRLAIDEKERELQQARRQAEGLSGLLREEDELTAALRGAKDRREELLRDQRRWALLESLWPDEVERREIEGALARMPPPSRGAAAWEAALSILLEERSLQQDRRERASRWTEAASRQRARATSLVASLGRGWTVERARGVDVSLPRRSRLEALGEEVRRWETEVERQHGRLQQVEERLELDRGEERRAKALLDAHGPHTAEETLQGRAVSLAELRAALADRDRAEQRMLLAGASGVRGGGLLGWVALVVSAAGFAAWAWGTGQGAMAAALLGVGVAAAFGALVVRGRGARGGGGEASPDLVLRLVRQRVAEHAAALGLPTPTDPTPGQVQAVAAAIDHGQRHLHRWEELHGRWQALARELAKREEEREVIVRAVTRAEEEAGRVAEAWDREVEDLGDGAPLAVEAAQARLARVVEVRSALETAEEAEGNLQELLAQIAAWERRGEELLVAAADAGAKAGPSLEARLLELGGRVAKERELESERAQRRGALERLERSLLEKMGEGQEAEALRVELATGDRSRWSEALARCDRDLEETNESISVLDQRLALQRREREALEASTAIPALAEEVEALRARWREGVRGWRRVALLERLLGLALGELQERQQPVVLQAASALFGAVTGGRYLRIRQVVDQRQVEVVDEGGRGVAASDLSRGTREQLYLCLRLGLVGAFAEQGIRLPLLMDDVLVNFDPARAAATARALAAISSEQQLLFFTCHPRTAELLRDVVPDAVMHALGAEAHSERVSAEVG